MCCIQGNQYLSGEEEEIKHKHQKEIAKEKVTLVFKGKWKMVLLKRGNVQPACSLTDKISMDTMVLGQLTGCLLVIK